MLIFIYDKETKRYMYPVSDYPDNYDLPANATTVEPVDSNGVGLYDPTWNETTNSWDSLTEEEWKKKYIVPEVKPEPTQEEQATAQQMLLMADLQNKVDTLTDTVDEMTKSNQQINATLAQIMLQNATNAENGGK
ncbi:hypothetical protein HZI56_01850 [Lactobacillus salivarius]|uniref:hypothetical protein n=1 Tax=Ligilactobacillus salivarius TaxID=1624 RepID=UPI0015C5B4F5|nr:hypothetical protein [Ligilactobacillus salivarius]NXZ96354.1 hypothetical protein [Ligilactobacillus salivarius]NYA58743.1 hypothetical protein [Ligilactobacillus salivarius]NYA61199.1 hypothetical protein [Ligilactobacillus salivarius]NYA63743.1 hypothetical protein [Ligilactobacillus salivarius]NYA63912.1 hypothetical protein [Ligilactobacillus salivarius]